MVLVKCQECRSEISSTAKSCPHCGAEPQLSAASTAKNNHFGYWIFSIFVALFAIIGIFGHQEALKISSIQVVQQEHENQKNIADFKRDRETIMSPVRGAMSVKDYKMVIDHSEKYLIVNDAELNQINASAKAALSKIQEATRRAKAVIEDNDSISKIAENYNNMQKHLHKYYASQDDIALEAKDIATLSAITLLHDREGATDQDRILVKKSTALRACLTDI